MYSGFVTDKWISLHPSVLDAHVDDFAKTMDVLHGSIVPYSLFCFEKKFEIGDETIGEFVEGNTTFVIGFFYECF